MTLNYTVASFMLLEVRPTLEVWRRLGWYGHWMTFLPLTFFWAGGGQLLRQQLGARRILEHDVKLQREVAGAKGANQLGYAAAGYEELKRE
jgi:lysophospholipid acyltransferase